MANLHTPEVLDSKIREIVEGKANVKLDIEWVPNSNYNEKLNSAFATNTLPQVVSIGSEQLDQFREAIPSYKISKLSTTHKSPCLLR